MSDAAPQLSPMEQLSQDPALAPIINNLRGAKLQAALKARLQAEPNPTRRRLLEEVLGNRRWFLEPITKAPTMSTVNGIGTMLYGESEKEADGTYVATLFFVFFFLPLVPIAQYLVRPLGGRKWSFFGKVPPSAVVRRWRQAIALGAALAAAGTAYGIAEHQGHSDVYFVNALDVPVKVHAGKTEVRIAANARERKRLAQGHYDVKVTTDDGRVIDEDQITIPGATDVVAYNVLGAAPLYHQPITYYQAGHEGKDNDDPVIDAGKKLISEDHIDYVFSEPPKEISMGEHEYSQRRWRFDLAPGGWKLSAGYLLTKKKLEEAARVVEGVAQARPDDEATLETVTTVMAQARGPAALATFAEKLALKFPEAVEPQRLYQSMMTASGRREEVVQKYRDRAAKEPSSATAGYLAVRLELPAEALPRYTELAAKFPTHVYIRRGLAWSLLQLRKYSESVAAFDELDKLPHRVNVDELEYHAQALIGAGRIADAAKAVAKHGDEGVRNNMLYARVATVAGKDAPFPADHFIPKKGEGRSWYEATFGAPGALQNLEPLDGAEQAACNIESVARQSGPAALALLEKAPPETLEYLHRPLTLLLAAEALRHGGKARAAKILDALAPPIGAAERDAILDGKDSPELTESELDVQAALELARAWRAGGAEAHQLIERARADDLLRGAVHTALAWK